MLLAQSGATKRNFPGRVQFACGRQLFDLGFHSTGFHFSLRLFDGFCDEDWDDAIGFVLVLLIRRVCFYRDIPESLSLN